MWTRIGLALGLLLSGVAPAFADGFVETSGTYSEGAQLRGFRFDTGGNLKVTPGTLLGGEHVDATEEAGYIRVQPRAGTVGGAVASRYISVGSTEDEHAVCTAACTVYSIAVTNVNAAVRYLKCNNATTANTTPGTSVPEIDLAVPGATTGAGITLQFPVGMSFDTALTCWLVTGAAESDVAEVAANELKVLYSYKQ
ncbi:MAG: hypothetical protein ABL983_03530 [Nitrospira sp.]